MIDVRTPAARPAVRRLRRHHRRRRLVAVAGVFGLLLAGGMVLGRLAPVTEPSAAPVPTATASSPAPSSAPPISATSAPPPLFLSGPVPTRGTGRFAYAAGRGRVYGTGGTLRRFRVAVEQGSQENVATFAAAVEEALGNRQSWTGDGRLRLQRVAGGDEHDFTVYLATRDTAGRMCARGGVNITVGGRPYTSCRTTGQAIINLDRWRLSAPPFTSARVPLRTYRQYVVNHEVGHELGEQHQGCPRRGGPAPVMVQQTLTLRGCTPNAWPRPGGRALVGPSLF
jgi:hypothetical protein